METFFALLALVWGLHRSRIQNVHSSLLGGYGVSVTWRRLVHVANCHVTRNWYLSETLSIRLLYSLHKKKIHAFPFPMSVLYIGSRSRAKLSTTYSIFNIIHHGYCLLICLRIISCEAVNSVIASNLLERFIFIRLQGTIPLPLFVTLLWWGGSYYDTALFPCHFLHVLDHVSSPLPDLWFR